MKFIFITIVILVITGCLSHTNQHNRKFEFDKVIQANKLNKAVIKGNQFKHLTITNNSYSDILHIYIEGDGIPWSTPTKISKDPTPNNPLAFKLMAKDPNFALYLGRPCYFDLADSKNCDAVKWTNGRYGEVVIDSMEAAILTFIQRHQVDKIVLIGYSGGGVIASLLAYRIKETQAYITIAANLDIDRWTQLHAYSPLNQSINPAKMITKNFIPGIHLVGQKDTVVPPSISQEYIKKNKGKQILFPQYTHACCWVENWPTILGDLNINSNIKISN
jgi:hypothetical protein